MDGLLRPISKNSISNHLKKNCTTVVDFTIVDYMLIGLVPLSWCYRWCWVLDWVGTKVSIASSVGNQWCRELNCVWGKENNVVSDEGLMTAR